MNPNKFNETKEHLITSAQRVAGTYLLSKYGSAHLFGDPKVEVTATEDQASSEIVFNGTITCYAEGLLNNVGINMTVNDNDIEVTSEDVQGSITEALNAAADHTDKVVASLDGFKLNDDGSKYLKVSHSDLQDANLGIVGKNEYATSPNKSELLQSIVKDAMLEMPVTFTGEFKEPSIEKVALEVGEVNDLFQAIDPKYADLLANTCMTAEEALTKGQSMGLQPKMAKQAALVEEIKPEAKKSSWLTAELFKDASNPVCTNCNQQMQSAGETDGMEHYWCEDCDIEGHIPPKQSALAIQENMPRGKSADHLAQTAQLEDQSALEAQIKVEHEAANSLLSMLQGLGHGSAKIVESARSGDGFDFMTAIDDAGSVKAVSIPVAIKEGKVVLPKKSLVSALISKGLDVKAKLAEQFDLDVLEKLAAIDEKIAYEVKEVNAILSEKASVEKEAAGEKQPFFDSDDSTMTLQKHLLPNHEDYKVGDKLSDGTDEYEIVNTDGQQNDKNEGSSSQWTLKKCQNPERDDKPAKNQIPS